MSAIPSLRIRALRDQPPRGDGQYVLYWMTAFRRTRWNYSLDRALEWARQLRQPLVILEALRCDYRWASDRLHRFVIEGMRDNLQACAGRPLLYYPYLEPQSGAGRGLLTELAKRASVVVGDDFPCFFLPRLMRAAAGRLETRFELVDSNGLLPLRAAPQTYARAFSFRRFLQQALPEHLSEAPAADPLAKLRLPAPPPLDAGILRRWPPATAAHLQPWATDTAALRVFPLAHNVGPGAIAGGARAAAATLDDFLRNKLPRYGERRNSPDDDVASGLSPYLHFGHISAHELFAAVERREQWTPDRLRAKPNGSAEGWWGMSPAVESFLDELITWRELGYNYTSRHDDYDRYESLPDWARASLAKHAVDRRSHVYSLAEFGAAATHDALWNAAQRQLVREGRLHNYLRMLWGKKILEWSRTPEEAFEIMIELNNRFALDGRNPNSYTGIAWVLGKYDRPWGPERPIFGVIRYMSSENTARKVSVKNYLRRFGPDEATGPDKATGAAQRALFD